MMQRRFLAPFLLMLSLLASTMVDARREGVVVAQKNDRKVDAFKSLHFPISEYRLKNGLRVIMSEDHAAPTYTVLVTYDVGSRNERRGRTGFAHLFEHMMFQGSENVGKGENAILVTNNGGQPGGGTTQDYTRYWEILPSNQLDLGLFLEADRMHSLVINQANLNNQLNAVQEEKRLNHDNQPYGHTDETILDTAYDNFAYKHTVIGSMDDLNAATVRDVADFFRTYYSPNNAVLTLVGDFQSKEALAKVKKYFEGIPAQPAPPALDVTEPEQKAERRKTIEDSFVRTPSLDISYKIPKANTPDFYALSVLGSILSRGQSSRLYQKLVKETQFATGAGGGAFPRRGPSLFTVTLLARPGKDLAQIEQLVYAELERLKNEPVADWELEKARLGLRNRRAQSLQSTVLRAFDLGDYAVSYNDPNLINTYELKYNAVTRDDIQRVARTYFKEANRTVVTTLPKPTAAPTSRVADTAKGQASDQKESAARSQVERKNRAPVSKDLLRIKLPKPVEATLENGLTLLILEDHRFPVVNVQLNIGGAGPIFEPPDAHGLANLTARMLREGTGTRTSSQTAEEVERLGATISASAGYGSADAVLNASGLSDNFDRWFSLFTDVLMNPSFPAGELAKLKPRIETQLREERTDPSFLADERFKAAVYGTHPASVVTTTPELLAKLTPEMLTAWHREHYVPQNAFLGIAGDVNAAELIAKLRKALAGWKRTDYKEAFPPNQQPTSAGRIFLINRPDSVQSTIVMGNIAVDRRSPDYLPFVVMDSIVGAGNSSRLFLNLREDKGYTYGAYSELTAFKYPGTWSASGDFRTDVTEGAMTELLRELRRIRDERVSNTELEEQKRALVANFALSLEKPAQVLNFAMLRKIYDLPANYWDTYPARVMAVTDQDVQRVARQYVNPETQQVVVVGDASKIKRVLEKFGPVEVYSTEGKPDH